MLPPEIVEKRSVKIFQKALQDYAKDCAHRAVHQWQDLFTSSLHMHSHPLIKERFGESIGVSQEKRTRRCPSRGWQRWCRGCRRPTAARSSSSRECAHKHRLDSWTVGACNAIINTIIGMAHAQQQWSCSNGDTAMEVQQRRYSNGDTAMEISYSN